MATASEKPKRVLLVEDDPTHALLMRESLEELEIDVTHASTHAAAVLALESERFALVILDVGLPDGSGFELQRWLMKRPARPAIVFVTSDDLVEHAVEAVRAGAKNYVVKRPNYLERMTEVVSEVLQSVTAEPPVRSPGERELVGESEAMQEVRRQILEFGPTDAAVLISGETGTGKELVARALHRASQRSESAFVAVNCAAISVSLFESELFGSVRGAFTGADRERKGLVGEASGGTLFLDEVGELPLEVQAKLLRLLEGGNFRRVGSSRQEQADVRVLAATNRDLEAAVARGGFRADLYYRLNVLRIQMPSLRERSSDIPRLARYFVTASGSDREPTESALQELQAASWPGNVRELEHAISRTLLQGGEGPIEHFDFGGEPASAAAQPGREGIARAQLVDLLTRHRGRLGPVAEQLGVSIRTVQRRMNDLDLRLRDFRPGRG